MIPTICISAVKTFFNVLSNDEVWTKTKIDVRLFLSKFNVITIQKNKLLIGLPSYSCNINSDRQILKTKIEAFYLANLSLFCLQ